MAIYKCGWEVEPGTTKIKFNEWSERVLNPGSPDLKASALPTGPHYLQMVSTATANSSQETTEISSKTGTVSSLVPSAQSNFLQRTANYGQVASRNYAEISQKFVNISIPCTENAQQPMAAPIFLSLIEIDLMVKCHPSTTTCFQEK